MRSRASSRSRWSICAWWARAPPEGVSELRYEPEARPRPWRRTAGVFRARLGRRGDAGARSQPPERSAAPGPDDHRGVRGHGGRAARLHRQARSARQCRDRVAAAEQTAAERHERRDRSVPARDHEELLRRHRRRHGADADAHLAFRHRARFPRFLHRDLRSGGPDAGPGRVHADAARQLLRRHAQADHPVAGAHRSGRRVHLQRSLRRRRPASAGHLHRDADFPARTGCAPGPRPSRTTPTSAASSPAATRSAPRRSSRKA